MAQAVRRNKDDIDPVIEQINALLKLHQNGKPTYISITLLNGFTFSMLDEIKHLYEIAGWTVEMDRTMGGWLVFQ